MFTTHRSAEIELSHLGDLQYAEARVWRYVEQELMYPWFYLQVARMGSAETDTSMLMIQHAQDIAVMVRSEAPYWRLEQIQIVTPAHMNGVGRWLMEPLQRITMVDSPSLGGPCECYEVSTGNRYAIAGSGVLENATLLQVIFDAAVDLVND
ncbi:hypothetical protein QEP73_17040 [Pseudomonas defluvii]|nr:hypothetical protein QEP73_17040 [Pseudomonas defluvii]